MGSNDVHPGGDHMGSLDEHGINSGELRAGVEIAAEFY